MLYLIDKNPLSASFANVPQPHHAQTMRLDKVNLPATNEIPVDSEKRQAILVDSTVTTHKLSHRELSHFVLILTSK